MKFECSDFERAVCDDTPALTAALARHAEACPACRTRLSEWQELSAAAGAMRKSWDSPDLWPRIRQQLETAAAEDVRRAARWEFLRLQTWRWRSALAIAALLVFCAAGTWGLLSRFQPPAAENRRLLTERALREIENAESSYVQSIDNLSKVTLDGMQRVSSPLMDNYREKLLLIDAAISDCRSDIQNNRFNAHLRRELLSIYQEKQRTLQQLMKEEIHEKQ